MMDYVYVSAVVSIILVMGTMTGCSCAMMIALTRKWIHRFCGTPEKKTNKIIEMPKTKSKTTNKPTEKKEA